MKDLICQAVSWYCCDHVIGDDDDEKYLVKLFAVTKEGERVSLNITGFTPFFFVKVPFKINDMMVIRYKTYVTNCLPSSLRECLINVKLFKKKEFYGFHHEDMFYYMRFTFNNMKAWRAGIKVFHKVVNIGNGIRPMKYKLYESTIEPHLRMMHIRDILPAGWIKVNAGSYAVDGEVLPTRCQADYTCHWTKLDPWQEDNIAPLCVASFDLECTSSHGDFPVPVKDYRKVANEILSNIAADVDSEFLHQEIIKIFLEPEARSDARLSVVYPKDPVALAPIERKVKMHIDDIQNIIRGLIIFDVNKGQFVARGDILVSRDDILRNLTQRLNTMGLPALEGDKIIQIGTTVHKYGEKACSYKNIITLGSCDPIEGVDVIVCQTEAEMILKWRDLIRKLDPDVITGYNIFGFDFSYIYQRACELQIDHMLCDIGRIQDHICSFEEKNLSSSALGENLLKFIDMQGRVLIDLMKIVQREHKLDSYKLDNVANHFMNMNKNDVHPNDIFRLYKGNSADRRVIAEYCIQDCALCNMLMMKLETLANSIGMANVCNVPLSYIIMRGQGIKIFSLVAKQCREDGFIIPTLNKGGFNDEAEEEDDEGYEGAIVLEPQCGIYIDDPVSVLDYASLYPSSMISENLSHDTIVLDPKYDNLPGLEYVDISYDIFEGVGDKKQKVGVKTCRYVQTAEKGVLPRILMKLLRQRKETRKKIEYKTVTLGNGESVTGLVKEKGDKIMISAADGRTLGEWDMTEVRGMEDTYNEFQKAVLDGLQLAYKVTANSLYGQCGARTSSIYMKEVAASTTATGRNMIIKARDFILENFQGSKIIYGDSVTGNTPTILRVNNRIVIETFENIARRFGGDNWLPCIPGNKEACELTNVEVWSKSGWTKVHRIIRHALAPHKKIIRVRTQSGFVDVTDDHSLFLENGNAISPKNVVPGMSLMMREYPCVEPIPESLCESEDEARIMGFFMGYGQILRNNICVYSWTIQCPDQVILRTYKHLCEKVYHGVTWNLDEFKLYPSVKAGDTDALKSLMLSYQMLFENKTIPDAIMNSEKNIRYAFWKGLVELNTDINGFTGDGTHVFNAQINFLKSSLGYKPYHPCPSKVNSLTPLNYTGYVYDFTTENHSFQAGVGRIIVSNTDSLFVQFDIRDENGNKITGKEAIPLSRKLGIQASNEIKKIIKKPHDLEWEKLFYPFILLSKKRYIANKYEHDDHKFKQTSMGVVMRRRDNSQIVKTIYGGVVDVILNERDIKNSLKFLNQSLQDLIDAKFPLEEFIITKSLKSEYKDPSKIAHKVLADRMKARDPGSAPQVNDRIPYVYIEVPGGKKVLQGDRIEHPDYIRVHNLKPDFEFYLTNQIMNPILQIYALVVEDLPKYNKGRDYFTDMFPRILRDKDGDKKKAKERWNDLREEEVKKLLFDPFLIKLKNKREGFKDLMQFLKIE